MFRVPDLPGYLVPSRSDQDHYLKSTVSQLCRLNHQKFPGSQPVSFAKKDLERLERNDYWVCEKSDGIRVLFFILPNPRSNDQSCFIIDRHNDYRELNGFFFPSYLNPTMPLGPTIIDGELVIDVDPATKKETLRFLAFDCLVINAENIMDRPLDKRYGRLKQWFFAPYSTMLRDHPQMAQNQTFDIQVKEIAFSYHVDNVFAKIPDLRHGNDGLIYTCVTTPYVPATDENILKWKPPSENSIDFKLVLRFPPEPGNPNEPDFTAKPFFALHVWEGGEGPAANYSPYDEMQVDDDEWEKLKTEGVQVDDRIVEVHWDPTRTGWRMMRFRDDKPAGNHKSVVEKIISSIADGVERDALLAHSSAIRAAWKVRAGQPPGPPIPSSSSHPQSQAHAQSRPAPSRQPAQQAPPQSHYVQPQRSSADAVVGMKYGPLASSMWSKVSGPEFVCGMRR